MLKNAELETGVPHLWAHIQEGVLASSATLLDDPSCWRSRSAAPTRCSLRRSSERSRGRTSSPYDVGACIYSLDRLHEATGDGRWSRLATDARAWFDGRNAAGAPVYDRQLGLVADGVDEDRVSANSGAEANIQAAEALFADAVAVALRMDDPFDAAPEA